MLGFASAIIGEQLTNGKGPLAQIGLGIGQPLNTELAGAGLFLWIGVFAVAAIGYGTTDDARFLGETDGDKRWALLCLLLTSVSVLKATSTSLDTV